MKPIFMLKADNNNVPFLFSVPPMDFSCQTGQYISTVNIIDLGDKTIPGKRKADRISFSTFLPNFKSLFYSLENPLLPNDCVQILKNWKDRAAKLTLIIPQYSIYYKCHIENFEWVVQERTGDIDISLSLVEIVENKTLVDEVRRLFVR